MYLTIGTPPQRAAHIGASGGTVSGAGFETYNIECSGILALISRFVACCLVDSLPGPMSTRDLKVIF